jgi:hypothetical protein
MFKKSTSRTVLRITFSTRLIGCELRSVFLSATGKVSTRTYFPPVRLIQGCNVFYISKKKGCNVFYTQHIAAKV